MSTIVAAGLFCFWILVAGLTSVYFEVESVYCGVRVQKLLEGEAKLLDELRRAELRYNEILSPDLLEQYLREDERLWREYRDFRYPVPDATEADTGAMARSGPR